LRTVIYPKPLVLPHRKDTLAMIVWKRSIIAALVLLLSFCAGIHAADQPRDFDSAGVKIRYVEKGTGEPVVLVHGFAANYQLNWGVPGIIDALSRDYRVIALDIRGHGGSGKPHHDAKYGEEMMDDVVRLLDHLKIEKAHIVGYSMGAFIANKLAIKHPDRVVSVVLGGGGWMRPNDARLRILGELADSLDRGEGITPLIIALTPSGLPRPRPEDVQLSNRLLMVGNDQKALAAVARTMTRLSVDESQVKSNRVPTLAIIGTLDPLEAGVDELREVMPSLKVVPIDGADHMTTFVSPMFVKSLKDFLAANSAASRNRN
jgi:pimeloyl-ACP methyl ester carboxylesterase